MNWKRINSSLTVAALLLVIFAFSEYSFAQSQAKLTIVEQSPSLPKPPRNTLGTGDYEPMPKEREFFAKLGRDEQTTGSMFEDYSINGKKGKYVGWFGIVRKIEEDAKLKQTRLVVENKYFDGLTDTHIQALSFNGGGDFTCLLSGTGFNIKPLSLVKVYGTVTGEDQSVPTVEADYLRQWDWGQFTFLSAYGEQRGNKEWKKLSKVKEDKIYNPFPDQKYYEERLGARKP
ncbi:MAG TPA: hypothetical protein VGC91_00075 [Pyrinomonadaceae bacterium]|jgi:hypothetical protein